ncbi:MAG: alanine racemase [Magnetococcales bacterium]|nr:alanine racemase [Magnetococcales bacterium]MBF0150610.1 alanine racemase [Magnetococcales bacterium]MBF0174269.1 alanine racemase [Magnetococcales bacterium]MBF0348267.1 alanine racemase [Magnetococcales bacterium]MBF0629374.1 alanine racemase [Magnetococcales bacterium]
MKNFRKTCLRIDLDAIVQNYQTLKRRVGDDVRMAPVLKADAYGLGIKKIVKVLPGLHTVCVATIEEGIALRRLNSELEIIILSGLSHKAFKVIEEHGLTPVVFEPTIIPHLLQWKGKLNIYLKIDTGMNRLGINRRRKKIVRQLRDAKNIRLMGIFSHFSSANDEDELEMEQQLRRIKTLAECHEISMANSAATMIFSESHCAMVRPGLALFGVSPFQEQDKDLIPALRLSSRIIHIKKIKKNESVGYSRTFRSEGAMRIAVVAMGYADGLSTRMSNRGYFLIKGQRAPIVGRVSMDMTTVDVTSIEDVAVGDRVIIIGRSGDEEILAEDVACWSEKSNYEILCNLGNRVKRTYLTSQ